MPKRVPREQRVAMGAAIIFWRRLRQLQQKELAELCGWKSGRLSKYETGDTWPGDEALRTLAKHLELTREALYEGQEALLGHRASALRAGSGPLQKEPSSSVAGGEIRETVSRLSAELEEDWQALERAETALRIRRRLLEIETQTSLLHVAIGRPAKGSRGR